MRALVLIMLLFIAPAGQANVEIAQFDDPKMEQRYKKLIHELRCLVCQNQNLADSNAELAQDLRAQVYKMLQQGKSDKEIIDFMVERYGDFVLYRPPFKLRTVFLWLGPFIFLLLGIWFLFTYIRRQTVEAKTELSTAEHERASALLGKNEEDKAS